MLFGIVGDIHGDFDALEWAMRRHEEVAFWLSVGDVASDDRRYPEPIAPLYWIKGNNEDFDFVASERSPASHAGLQASSGARSPGTRRHRNLHFLQNGSRTDIDGVTVVALGGTFAPTWYDTPADALPVRGRDDKRRHFVREEVEACERMRGVDVLLTHEAPRPYIVEAEGPPMRDSTSRAATRAPVEDLQRHPGASAGSPMRGSTLLTATPGPVERRRPHSGASRALDGPRSRPRRFDAGKAVINQVLAAMRPRLHCFGHHHRFSDSVREGVRSIGLDLISRSFVIVDLATFSWERIDTEGI
jgi:predicted phosphodiesterase